MNRDSEIWFETNLLGMGDSATDAAVRALELGDLNELGRIVAAHINTRLSISYAPSSVAGLFAATAGYELTESGYAALDGGL